MNVPADIVATSAGWGLEQPSPAFFARIVEEVGLPASAIAYVGDRLDNDIRPALAAGMTAIHINRGLWAEVQKAKESDFKCVMISSLRELPALLKTFH